MLLYTSASWYNYINSKTNGCNMAAMRSSHVGETRALFNIVLYFNGDWCLRALMSVSLHENPKSQHRGTVTALKPNYFELTSLCNLTH